MQTAIDEAAFFGVYGRHLGYVRAIARRHLRDVSEAEDARRDMQGWLAAIARSRRAPSARTIARTAPGRPRPRPRARRRFRPRRRQAHRAARPRRRNRRPDALNDRALEVGKWEVGRYRRSGVIER
jgi:hypothetical protein